MNKSELLFEAEKVLRQRNYAIIICVILLSTNIILSCFVLGSKRDIVLVPSYFSGDFYISKEGASKNYIEALSRDIASLMLNLTPSNTEYAKENILKMVHPNSYSKIKSVLFDRFEDIEKRKISTYFTPKNMSIKNEESYITGDLGIFLGKKRISLSQKTYHIKYGFVGLRPLIMKFEEVENDK